MDDIEKRAIELVKGKVSVKLDPLPCLKELLDRHIINDDQYTMFRQDASRRKGATVVWFKLFEHFQRYCSFLTLIEILMKTGYVGLAEILVEIIKHGNGYRRITRVHKIQTHQRKPISLFFNSLKSQVDDTIFLNSKVALRMLANRFHDKIGREENISRKHFLVDKLVAILGVAIDVTAITFDDNLSRNRLFDELKSLRHGSSNSMMTDVSFYCRLANACLIGGRVSEGKDMLMQAQCSASNFTTCLEIVDMYYMQLYVLLWEFERTRSQQLKQSLLEVAAKGIASLQEEDDEIRIPWTRMFLLRMVFCLLGIGNRTNILPGYSPSQEDIRQAQLLLQTLRWEVFWKGIETRREMFYWMAMSRLNALTGDVSVAKSDISKAQHLALSGKFKEVKSINNFSKDLMVVDLDTSQKEQ